MATFLLIAAVAGLVLDSNVLGQEGSASGLFERAEVVLVPYSANPSVVVDGKIAAGEYSSYGAWTDPSSGLSVNWIWDGTSVFVALSTSALGWMALGFSPDLGRGMGLLLITEANGTFQAVQRLALNVSDEAVLSIPASGADVVVASNFTRQGTGVTAEFRLAANSSLWDLKAGELVPTVVAFNVTSTGVPSSLAGSEVRFLRSYFLRPQDDPAELQRLFMEQISPVLGLVAVGVMGTGVAAILVTFVRRKGAK